MGMDKPFKFIRVCSVAAMVWLALQTATTFRAMKLRWDEAISDHRSLMQGLATNEYAFFDTPTIVKILQKALDHAFLPDLQLPKWKYFIENCGRGVVELNLQKIIAMLLKGVSVSFNCYEFLNKRLARRQPYVSEATNSWWSFSGPYLLELCSSTLARAP